MQLLSTPSVAADVDSGPDSAPDPGTDEEDERDTRLPGEDLSELPPAPLGRGRRGEEGKEPLLPTGWEAVGRLQGGCRKAAAPLTLPRCRGGRGVGGQHPTGHPVLATHPCWGSGRRARPDPWGGESFWGQLQGKRDFLCPACSQRGQAAGLAAAGGLRWGSWQCLGSQRCPRLPASSLITHPSPSRAAPKLDADPKVSRVQAGASRVWRAGLGAFLRLIPPPFMLMCPQTLRPQEWPPG